MAIHTGKWQGISIPDTALSLETDLVHGLSSGQVTQRQEQFGPNALAERPRPGFLARLWAQLNDFLILILIVSAIISAVIGWNEFRKTGEMTEFIDAFAIMTIVVLNAVMGLVQEGRAEQALAALKKMAAPNAAVIRDGRQQVVPASTLVPGDLVVLETGNYVPADIRLVESINLRIEEASLTGESVPVEKVADMIVDQDAGIGDRRNCGYMSTTVTYGRGKGIVIDIGMKTEIGTIAEMIQATEEDLTPLQLKLEQLGKWLGIASLAICAIVGIIGILRDTDLSLITSQGFGVYFTRSVETLIEMFMIAVSLAIAAVPEGLPAVVTICLAIGMQEMARRHALIRRLPAVETLGSATAICSDKTGTLTQNQMTVKMVYADSTLIQVAGQGYIPQGEFSEDGARVTPEAYPGLAKLALASVLCNDADLERNTEADGGEEWQMIGDPTEGAMVVLAAKAGLWRGEVNAQYPRVEEVPFDSKRKRMATIHRLPDDSYEAYVKGAPDILLELCNRFYVDGQVYPMTPERRERAMEVNHELASNALRVLGVAYKPLATRPTNPTAEDIEHDMVFVGLVGMIDPARPEVRHAIATARHAGIKTAMVTGDYEDTAVAIAKELELLRKDDDVETRVLSGRELERISDAELVERVNDIVVYARVSPEHKVRIVDAHKQKGHIVAMTGDGVNDAPALKRASIGVAMGITGTDVSKETADMVLTDDNFASIVSAVEQGRIIYSNIRKFVYYLLSCNMGEIMILFVSMILDLPLPLTALQLLVLNLVTDGAPALALGMEKGDPDIMNLKPRRVDEPIINRSMIWGTAVQTLAIAGSVLAAFLIGLVQGGWSWGLDVGEEMLAHAQTMAFVTLSASELFRAYTARSERYSLFSIGVFSNKWMQWAVLASLLVLLATVYIPGLNDTIFGNVPLSASDWLVVFPLMLVPAIVAEIYKAISLAQLRRQLEAEAAA
ncbi:MAG: cation-translocating P-type ATPase [Anaerolineae bacterium]|nr:cation-translocating P-type ATPase [Anaerolineae bacterium]